MSAVPKAGLIIVSVLSWVDLGSWVSIEFAHRLIFRVSWSSSLWIRVFLLKTAGSTWLEREPVFEDLNSEIERVFFKLFKRSPALWRLWPLPSSVSSCEARMSCSPEPGRDLSLRDLILLFAAFF